MSTYPYTQGSYATGALALAQLSILTPVGASDPVADLDDAIIQIKKYLTDDQGPEARVVASETAAKTTSTRTASGAITAVSGDTIWISPSDDVSLPAAPTDGDWVVVIQESGDLATTSAQVDGGTKDIKYNGYKGLVDDPILTFDENLPAGFKFTFNTTQDGWYIT